MRQLAAAVLLVSAFTARTALAIPPPWELEAMKAKADVIAVCTVGPVMGNERRMTAMLTVEQALQPVSFEQKRVSVSFDMPPMRLGAGEDIPGIAARTAGDTGRPQPVAGETVLVFLEAVKERLGAYKVIAGTWGYIPLKTGSVEETAATVKRIGQYREFTQKIADEGQRKLIETVYDKTLAGIQTPRAPKAPGILPKPEVSRPAPGVLPKPEVSGKDWDRLFVTEN